jgi:hypothetical protein
MAYRVLLAISLLGVVLGCGPGLPGETKASDTGDGGDGDPGDGDPGDGDPGDGDPGDADGENTTTGPNGDGDPDPTDETGDSNSDSTGDGDGDECAVLGFLMAPCNGDWLGCLDGWTCHFYDSVDMWGTTPVGNCSPPCDDDSDCEWMGTFGGECMDRDIVCTPYGADGVARCILPCSNDDECYTPHQYCDENLGLCLTNGP